MKTILRLLFALGVLVPALLVVLALGMVVGPADLTIADVWAGLTGTADAPTENIVMHLRLPRALLAAGVGAMVATAGAVFQSALRNPLADPLLLGVAGGAAVGAALVIALTGLAGVLMQLGAFAGALLTMMFVLAVAARARRGDPTTMLLAGVVASAFHAATLMMILAISPRGGADRMIQWSLGDFGSASLTDAAWALGAAALLTPVAALAGRTLNVLTLGDESAMASGVNVPRVRAAFYTLGAALTGVSVAVAGIVGFVGLIMPHAARRLFGPDHRVLVPASALLGAAVAVLADVIARSALGFVFTETPAAIELPVGSVTAFLGAPFFLYLLVKTAGRAAA